MLIHFLILVNSCHCCYTGQGEVSKGKQIQFYFNLKNGNLGGNLNPILRPSICANEGNGQNDFCLEIQYLLWMWNRSSARDGTGVIRRVRK